MAEVGLSRSIMIDVPIGVTTDGRLTLCTRTQVAGATMGAGEDRSLEPDGGAVVAASTQNRLDPIAAAYDPSLDSLASLYGSADGAAVGDAHLTGLFELAEADVAALVDDYRETGIDASSFVASQRVANEAIVGAVFDELRERLDPEARAALDESEATLVDGLGASTDVFAAGVGAYDGASGDGGGSAMATGGSAPTGHSPGGDGLDYHRLLHHVGDAAVRPRPGRRDSHLELTAGGPHRRLRGGSPVHGDGEHGLLSRRAARANPRGQGARCARGDRHGVRRAESRGR